MTDTRAPGSPDVQGPASSTSDSEPAVTEAAAPPQPNLAAEVADLKDRLLRTLADMENLRRRTEREVADLRIYGVANFARDVVGVADNMRRALDAVGADLREKADGGVKALIDGIDLTERELLKALEKHGVRKLDPAGQKFDPHLHQAMFEIPDATVPTGTVLQVVQSGYTLGERVLRPALVGIAKGGPKVVPANDNGGLAAAKREQAPQDRN